MIYTKSGDARGKSMSAVFGLGLETGLGDVGDILRNVRLADDGGLDLVSLSDHPYFADRIDAYAALGVVLGMTRNLTAAVNVSNLPSRPAPMLARTIAGLSALSGGRVVAGIGAGGMWDEAARLGVPRRTPAESIRAMEEAVVLIRALTGGGRPVSFDGEFYQVTELMPSPVAVPPIWIGSLGPKALTVTGKLADGWIPGHAADWRSTRVREARPLIDEAAAAAGRDPAEIGTIYNIPGQITTQSIASTRSSDGRWIGGSTEQWVDELTAAVLDHGAAGFIYFPVEAGSAREIATSRWTLEIAPAVRDAVERA